MSDPITEGKRLSELPFVGTSKDLELYGVKDGVDYRTKAGQAQGLATLAPGTGKVPDDELRADIVGAPARLDDAEDRLDVLEAGQGAGMIGFATKALMDADLAHDAGTLALVTNDGTPANNGTYRKTGASGAGSWVVSADRVSGLEVRATALEAIAGEEYGAFIQNSDDDIAVGGYPAVRSARAAGRITRFYGEVINGAGAAQVRVIVNGFLAHGPEDIEAGSPVAATGLAIDIEPGDNITFDVAEADDVSGLWLQLDGGMPA